MKLIISAIYNSLNNIIIDKTQKMVRFTDKKIHH